MTFTTRGPVSETSTKPYRILAQKYRPTSFNEVIGQEILVKTVCNAIESNRLPNAWILTGIRGIGKTSIARIIARSLNCIGLDGKGTATPTPCRSCDNCIAISEDRHVDVIEMDAASRTGVADIREIIESVKYLPTSARYKVYIIDEVHMLSTAAFNALLKTLEEPPSHVKFVFATTEIRKLPVTVLSRCQRFDLRRVSIQTLMDHLSEIAAKETFNISPEALQIIATSADGSIRDGLSLLDQAMSNDSEEVTDKKIKNMLGLADKNENLTLFKSLMEGKTPAALEKIKNQYELGLEPSVIVQELLEITHWVTRLKITPEIVEDLNISEQDKQLGEILSKKLSIPILTRVWQILLKGLNDIRISNNSLHATEMLIIRLSYASDLPPPSDLIKKLRKEEDSNFSQSSNIDNSKKIDDTIVKDIENSEISNLNKIEKNKFISPSSKAFDLNEKADNSIPKTFLELIDLSRKKKEPRLNHWLIHDVHLVHFEIGHLEIRLRKNSNENFVGVLNKLLNEWTKIRWMITISNEDGSPTLAQQNDAKNETIYASASQEPLVKTILDTFPNSKISNIENKSFKSQTSGENK
ncbi:MAG: DNA polymerase III subunit gamma/tau [Rhodospirillaceae bacterium]|nr:DNA polymerase III subunit gamma/tau [Rhodospirillaceae bacterium]